jgi:hypothetical protein
MNTKSKKTVLGFIAVSAIAALSAINVSINSKETGLSDISLANVEALAVESEENGYSDYKTRLDEDKGRTRIWIDGSFKLCDTKQISCTGSGNIACVAALVYTNCQNE